MLHMQVYEQNKEKAHQGMQASSFDRKRPEISHQTRNNHHEKSAGYKEVYKLFFIFQ